MDTLYFYKDSKESVRSSKNMYTSSAIFNFNHCTYYVIFKHWKRGGYVSWMQLLLHVFRHTLQNLAKHIHEDVFGPFLSLCPEGVRDIAVQLCDSWLDRRDKGVQINLHPSKWVSVTVGIKRFWLASQMTDVRVPFPPQWPADKPRIRDRGYRTVARARTYIQTCTRSACICA